VKLFNHLQNKAQINGMELLILALSILFQIDVSYFYKSTTFELKVLLHMPMVKPNKLLKFFQFIKFTFSQSLGSNFTMMPNVDKDLLAKGQDHQFNLLSQSDLNSCTKYGSTHLCKGGDVIRTDLNTTCMGAYYLGDLTTFQNNCKFDIVPAKEHVFQIAANQWILSSPLNFTPTLICSKTFSSMTIRSSSTITVPAGCDITLKSHIIQLDSATTDSDLDTIHYKWSYNSNVLFPNCHVEEFETKVEHLQNLTAASIISIKAALEE
jgi:hypothetical protein